jgi:hypothetical protein
LTGFLLILLALLVFFLLRSSEEESSLELPDELKNWPKFVPNYNLVDKHNRVEILKENNSTTFNSDGSVFSCSRHLQWPS